MNNKRGCHQSLKLSQREAFTSSDSIAWESKCGSLAGKTCPLMGCSIWLLTSDTNQQHVCNTFCCRTGPCQAASFPKTPEETESGRDSFSLTFLFHAPSFHPALVNPPSYGQATGTSSAPKSAFFAATSRGIMALPSMSKAKISTSGAACASSWAAWATRRWTSLVVWLAPKPRTSFGRETIFYTVFIYFIYLLYSMYIYNYLYYILYIITYIYSTL